MTKLLYLQDTYQFNGEAKVIAVKEHPERGLALILDQTIFYPQGGGQPADHGWIKTKSGSFQVTDVRLDPEGTVWHFGEFTKGEIKPGEEVGLEIDKDRRLLNARLHTAGHLIDIAVRFELGLDLQPNKGFHFPDGPYAEFVGILEEPAAYIEKIEDKLADLCAANLDIVAKDLESEEAERLGIKAPPGKAARVVKIGNYPAMGCGGTHVANTGEIGQVKIRKMSNKKGKVRVGYEVRGDNLH